MTPYIPSVRDVLARIVAQATALWAAVGVRSLSTRFPHRRQCTSFDHPLIVIGLRPQSSLIPEAYFLPDLLGPHFVAVPPTPPPSPTSLSTWSAPNHNEDSDDSNAPGPEFNPRLSETSSEYSDDGGFRSHVFVRTTTTIPPAYL